MPKSTDIELQKTEAQENNDQADKPSDDQTHKGATPQDDPSASNGTENSQEESEAEVREFKDFEKLALVRGSSPPAVDPFIMDGTSHTEISIMLNDGYSKEIIEEAKDVFDLSKLEELKKEDPGKYLDEAKKQVTDLCNCAESLTVHTTLFNVSFLIAKGIILNDVEVFFGKKSKYVKWLKGNFGHKHLRYFQHAKQLANMGDFARDRASLGKNRLLDFDRLDKEPSQSYEDLIRAHPFEDTTEDLDGSLFREHIDSIITYYRLKDADIEFVEFDQAALIASFLRRPFEVNRAKKVKDWLGDQQNPQEAFEDFLLNRLIIPYGDDSPPLSQKALSLNKVLAGVVGYQERSQIDDDEWVKSQKEMVSEDIILEAHQFIVDLAEKFGIDLTQGNGSEENNTNKTEGGSNDNS